MGTKVTVTDEGTGETEEVVITDDYVLICDGKVYVHGTTWHANGTHVITVRGNKVRE